MSKRILLIWLLGMFFQYGFGSPAAADSEPLLDVFDEEQARVQLTNYYQKYFDLYHLDEEIELITVGYDSTTVVSKSGQRRSTNSAKIGLKNGTGIEVAFTWDAIVALANGDPLPLWECPLSASEKYPMAQITPLVTCVAKNEECVVVDTSAHLHCLNRMHPGRENPRFSWEPAGLSALSCGCQSGSETFITRRTTVDNCQECFSRTEKVDKRQCERTNTCSESKKYKYYYCFLDFETEQVASASGLMDIKVTVPGAVQGVVVKIEEDCTFNRSVDLVAGENTISTDCSAPSEEIFHCTRFYLNDVSIAEAGCRHYQ